jgi:hypothetical protein
MVPPVRGVGGFRLMTMALALGIWGLSGSSVMAQGGGAGVPAASGVGAGYTGGPAYGVPGVPSGPYGVPSGGAGYTYVGYGPGPGIFMPGYPGYGLEYSCRDGVHDIHRHLRQGSVHQWGAYVLGKECLYPYVADPYTDPRAALGFWPPYSAPVAGTTTR